jgi:hypothetical protein
LGKSNPAHQTTSAAPGKSSSSPTLLFTGQLYICFNNTLKFPQIDIFAVSAAIFVVNAQSGVNFLIEKNMGHERIK